VVPNFTTRKAGDNLGRNRGLICSGPNQFHDPFGELTKLQQEGSIKDYQAKFESLLFKIGTLSPTKQVSCFVSGLEESIKAEVLARRPNNLSSAIGLARVYEARKKALRRMTPSDGRQNNNLQTRPALPINKLTAEELRERQEKGLCFKCNDKYSSGHRCKRLFIIEACLGEDDDGGVGKEDDKEYFLQHFLP
jgi:hypothetical protein